MRLMFIIPRLSGGGAERVITTIASGLAERHQVYLVSIWDPIGHPYPVSDRVTTLKLKSEPNHLQILQRIWRLFRMELFPRMKQAKVYWNHQYKTHSLQKLKRKYHIDCSISFLTPANNLNAAAVSDSPSIISVRSCLDGDYAPPESKDPVRREQMITSFRHADRIVSVSKEAVHGIVNSFGAAPEKVTVIYNPCNLARIRALGQETPDDEAILRQMKTADFVFLSSARITPKKGQWHLLHAFHLVLKQHPNSLLVIVGKTGEDATEQLLKDTVKELQLEGHVILAGFRKNPFSYLAKGDAFVMSSFNEGFPNAMIEALALGLPVISTDCRSGPREILAPGTDCMIKTAGIDYAEYGILVPECSGNQEIRRPPEESEQLMAEAMIHLMEKPELREHYARKGPERAGQFSEPEILRQWEQVIYAAVAEKEHARET